MLPPFRLGVGGRLGSGRQWMPWIHLDDVTAAMVHLLEAPAGSLEPVYNLTAPNPATNADFTRALGKALSRRPTIFPVPGFGMRLAFGEMAGALLLSGQRVVPRRLLASGFEFQYPEDRAGADGPGGELSAPLPSGATPGSGGPPVRPDPDRRLHCLRATTVAGAMLGLLTAYQSDIPLIEELEGYEGTATTIVYDRDGAEIGQFAVERRIEVEYEDLPQHLRDALVASEDQRFWQHFGFDPIGIARALWDNVRAGRIVSGASTITQQVARDLFLNREETLERKIKEAITAFRIERAYRKEEILTFYANQVHLGYNNEGIEAAAQFYLNKTASELSVGESAMLVGIAPNPSRWNPFRNLEAAERRRDVVLERMVAERVPFRRAAGGGPSRAGPAAAARRRPLCAAFHGDGARLPA